MANKKLNAQIIIGGKIESGLRSAFSTTDSMMKRLGQSIGDLSRRQRMLGDSIQVFGRLGRNVDGLRTRYAEATRAVDNMRRAQERLDQANRRSARIQAMSGTVRNAGVGASVGGGLVVASLVPGVNEAKHYSNEQSRIAGLGMGKETNEYAEKFVAQMKTFGTSQLENLELMRDGMSVFADLHHAEMVAPLLSKMKFANKAVFGRERGEQQSQQFMDMLKVIETRGGLSSEAEFNKQANIIQQVISATGGRVSATEWRHMLMTGGLAGKGMDSDALFYTFEHLVQEMGGDRAGTGLNSMYKSLYQGVAKKRSIMNLDKLGLIGNKKKVKFDKAGQVGSMEPGALLGANLFRRNPFQWMEKVLLPQLAKKGITEEKQVIDTIGMIVSNSVGGSFLAEMYRQRNNIHRAEARNRGAMNVDQLYEEGKEGASGKELDAEAKLADLKLKVGNQLLPIYARGLEMVSDGLERLGKLSAENPGLTKAMTIGVAALGAGLLVLGPTLIAVSGSMLMYASARMMLARVAASNAAAGGVGALSRAFSGLAARLPVVLSVIRMAGVALMTTPFMAIATGIAVAGVAIYRNWDLVASFFSGFGKGLSEGLEPVKAAFTGLYDSLGVLKPVFDAIGTAIGAVWDWFTKLLDPITHSEESLKTATTAGESFGKLVGGAINLALTPLKLLMEGIKWIGDNAGTIMDKASSGIAKVKGIFTFGSGDSPAVPVVGSGSQPLTLPTIAGTSGGLPDVTSIGGSKVSGPSLTDNSQTKIYVTQQPGQSVRDLADEVTRIQEEKRAARQRGAMNDGAE